MNELCMKKEIYEYLIELIRRNAISRDSLKDWMFINYLCESKIDSDFFRLNAMDKKIRSLMADH